MHRAHNAGDLYPLAFLLAEGEAFKRQHLGGRELALPQNPHPRFDYHRREASGVAIASDLDSQAVPQAGSSGIRTVRFHRNRTAPGIEKNPSGLVLHHRVLPDAIMVSHHTLQTHRIPAFQLLGTEAAKFGGLGQFG